MGKSVVGDDKPVLDSVSFIFAIFVFNYLFDKICLTLSENVASNGMTVFFVVIVLVFAAIKQNSPDIAETEAVIRITQMSRCIFCKFLCKIAP